MNQIIEDKWINIDEAAEYLGIKTVTLRGWIKKYSNLPARRIGKQWKFKRSELDDWVKTPIVNREQSTNNGGKK